MRIAILGSTGQIGSGIYSRLRTDYPEAEIIACSRRELPLHMKFDPLRDDWTSLGKLDVLINSVGIIRETKDVKFTMVHNRLTEFILSNRQLMGNPRIIQISVLSADKDSKSDFLRTKAEADEHLLSRENTVVVRPSIVCTHNTMIVQKFRMLKRFSRFMGRYLPIPSGIIKTRIQPILGEDLLKIISALCKSSQEGIIEAGGPAIISIGELMRKYLLVKPVPVNQKVADFLIPFITKLLPGLIGKDQYLLLKNDNVISRAALTNPLIDRLSDTDEFWKSELK